jgi:hypothetical protein
MSLIRENPGRRRRLTFVYKTPGFAFSRQATFETFPYAIANLSYTTFNMIARRLASRTHSFRIIDMAPVDTGQKANANLDHNETENATRDHLRRAQDAAEHEKATTFLQALKIYPAAVGWSVLLSTAIIMEGYDMKLIGSLNAQPAFAK